MFVLSFIPQTPNTEVCSCSTEPLVHDGRRPHGVCSVRPLRVIRSRLLTLSEAYSALALDAGLLSVPAC